MRNDLGIEGLGDLVERPLVATLATYRADGSVLLSPVWHEWRGGSFHVPIEADDVKVRHVNRNARVAFALYESEPPYRGLELRTTAELVPDVEGEAQLRIAQRYLGPERGRRYGGTPTGDEMLLRLSPGELRTWDFADVTW